MRPTTQTPLVKLVPFTEIQYIVVQKNEGLFTEGSAFPVPVSVNDYMKWSPQEYPVWM